MPSEVPDDVPELEADAGRWAVEDVDAPYGDEGR